MYIWKNFKGKIYYNLFTPYNILSTKKHWSFLEEHLNIFAFQTHMPIHVTWNLVANSYFELKWKIRAKISTKRNLRKNNFLNLSKDKLKTNVKN